MNLLPIGRSFSPFTLPLFFNFTRSNDPLESGIIGALANTLIGVSCIAEVDYDRDFKLDFIYGSLQLHMPWLEEAIKFTLKHEGIEGLKGVFDYNFEANFGLDFSSASAVLIASLSALKKALNLKFNPIDLGLLSHSMELYFEVGFGCTYSQLLGGIVLFLTPSVPGKAKYVKFSFPDDLRIVIVGAPTNRFQKYTLSNISLPSISNDLTSIKNFNDLISTSLKFQSFFASLSPRLKGIVNELQKLNILSYGFGFLGNTIYTLVYRDYLIDVISLLLDFFPAEYITVSEFDPVGVRVYL
ncbi:MAG: hypothetical protein QXJ66_00580 [Candidatus Methanomethylicia archaeon]